MTRLFARIRRWLAAKKETQWLTAKKETQWLTAKKETQAAALARLRADPAPPPPAPIPRPRRTGSAIPCDQVDWAAGADATVVYYAQSQMPPPAAPVTTGKLWIPGIDRVGVLYNGLTVRTTPCWGRHRQYQFKRLIAPDATLETLLARLACRRVPYLILAPADGTPAVRLDRPWTAACGATIRAGDLKIVERLALVAVPSARTPAE